MILGLELEPSDGKFYCCIKSKIICKPLPKEPREHAKKPGDRVYSDVWGPARHATLNKQFYYVSFTDDNGHESVLYLMRTKDEAFCKYKLSEVMVNRQRNVHIKELVTDQGGEYTSNEFETYLKEQGMKHRLTVHDTPEQNGVTEHLNHTLVEKACAMLFDSGLPKTLWAMQFCMQITSKITPLQALLNKTPYEVMHQEKPNLHNSHEWESDVFMKIKQGYGP